MAFGFLKKLKDNVTDVFDAFIWYYKCMRCNDCETKPLIKGMCNKHYLQLRRHGKLFVTKYDRRDSKYIDGVLCLPLGIGASQGWVKIDEKFKYLENTNWTLTHGYPCSSKGFLHRIVMNAPKGTDVDHIFGDLLDSRCSNLRLCTRGQNNMNRKVNNVTGFKGVYWHKVAKKYAARIMYKKKSYHLGLFVDAKSAAEAYDLKAKELFGDFARLNYGS